MWENILSGAVYGALGGAVGALLGYVLSLPFLKTKAAKTVSTVLTVVGVIAGINLAEPVLSPVIGKYLPKPALPDDFDAQIDAEIEALNDPLINALIRRDPVLKEQFREQVQAAVKDAANPAEARRAAFIAGASTVAARLKYHLPRGREEDLVEFGRTLVTGLQGLSASDPRFCYTYLFDPGAMSGQSIDKIKAKFSPGQFDKQQAAAAKVVENAFDDIPAYDVDAAKAAVERGVFASRDAMGAENLDLITGARRPSDEAQAKLACDGTIALYESLLSDASAASALRHLFVLAG